MIARGPTWLGAAALIAGMAVAALAATAQPSSPERKALVTPMPAYPVKAKDRRLEGDVQVCYDVDRAGAIHRPRIASTSDRVFNRAALKAARGLKYEALAPGAGNRRTRLCSTFRFRLTRTEDPASEPAD